MPSRTGQPLVIFLLTYTTTTVSTGQVTAVLDVQVQNESNCTLSFPYTLTLRSRTASGQLVTQDVPGTVTNLRVNTTVPAHNDIAISPTTIYTSEISITPQGEPVRTECPGLVGSWTGSFSIVDDDWNLGGEIEQGALYLTVPQTGPLALRYVRYTDTGQPTGESMSLEGMLTPDYEFRGQGLSSLNQAAVDTVQAAGLLKLALLDPVTSKPQLHVRLRIKHAKNPTPVITIQALVARQ
jgi:hypothetical protein